MTASEDEAVPHVVCCESLERRVDPGLTSTALNDFQGTRTVEQGAAHIIAVALRGTAGPTGKFTSDEGTVPW